MARPSPRNIEILQFMLQILVIILVSTEKYYTTIIPEDKLRPALTLLLPQACVIHRWQWWGWGPKAVASGYKSDKPTGSSQMEVIQQLFYLFPFLLLLSLAALAREEANGVQERPIVSFKVKLFF